jgi:hypothetical protein
MMAPFVVSIYFFLSAALAFTWKMNSLPTVFIGFAIFLALLYCTWLGCTIPQMDSEMWHNYDREDEPSFGTQFQSSLFTPLMMTHGLSAAFLLSDKTAEVRMPQ